MIADSPHVAARLASPTRCRKATHYRNGRRTKARYLASRRTGHEIRDMYAGLNPGLRELRERCSPPGDSRKRNKRRQQKAESTQADPQIQAQTSDWAFLPWPIVEGSVQRPRAIQDNTH